MQKKTIYLFIVCIIMLLHTIAPIPVQSQNLENEFFINLDLDFFNRFNKGTEQPLTDTFQRYHMLTLGYIKSGWEIECSYNWNDSVNGPVSTHIVTPWRFSLQKELDDQQNIKLDYIWVQNLQKGQIDSNVIRIQYNRQDQINDQFLVNTQIGGKLIDGTKILPISGCLLTYRDSIRLGINFLEVMDEHLLDDQDYKLNLPINLGATYHFSNYVDLDLDYYHFLIGEDQGRKHWFRTVFKFKIL